MSRRGTHGGSAAGAGTGSPAPPADPRTAPRERAVRYVEQRDDVRHEDLPDGFWGDVIDHLHVGDVDAARDAWEDLPDARRVAAPMPTSALYERVLGRWRAGV